MEFSALNINGRSLQCSATRSGHDQRKTCSIGRIRPRVSPQLEDVFSLLVVVGDLAGGLTEADGNFSVVGDAVRRALVVLIEAQTSLPQQAVHVLPRSAHRDSKVKLQTFTLDICIMYLY